MSNHTSSLYSSSTSNDDRYTTYDNNKKEIDKNNSILQFDNINFEVRTKNKKNLILKNISGSVNCGHVLAVMGPSGAGKTTLISALTLDALYGKASGSVTLNGVHLTDEIFKQHCAVVKQKDDHWPYLTTRETLRFAAQLYGATNKNDNNNKSRDISSVVDTMITKMGLQVCARTYADKLSGGQKRRLSIALALLKRPTLLFLDEPTSGLDAAAASNIMEEITRLAREEHIIILCTIHQPSSKVYNGFDQVMILSKGRVAFSGSVRKAAPYFESIGYPVPPLTNAAEHFLDLVNSDFSSSDEVEKILNSWEQHHGNNHFTKKNNNISLQNNGRNNNLTTTNNHSASSNEISIMFYRHAMMMLRDPILYMGRAAIFLLVNTIFSLTYWSARNNGQDQALNKIWILIWLASVPASMGVAAILVLNNEFKSILKETKNGMVSSVTSYALAKTLLVIPIILIFALVALLIPGFILQSWEMEVFLWIAVYWSVLLYYYECAAEFLSVVFESPIMGILVFMMIWFGAFLFSGLLISLQDMNWPFKLFYYIFPFTYYIPGIVYKTFIITPWESCTTGSASSICVDSTDGIDIIKASKLIFPLLASEDRVIREILIVISMAIVFKILWAIALIVKTHKASKFSHSNTTQQQQQYYAGRKQLETTFSSTSEDTTQQKHRHQEQQQQQYYAGRKQLEPTFSSTIEEQDKYYSGMYPDGPLVDC